MSPRHNRSGDGEIRALAESSERAAQRLVPYVLRTPLEPYAALSGAIGADVFVKLENLQHTGSFKYRGAVNRLLTLDEDVRKRGVVVASSGNHAAACAKAMRELDTGGVVFVPSTVSKRKLKRIEAEDVDVRLFEGDGLETELAARRYAGQRGMFYLSPYNDLEVVAGQGSIGVELVQQLDAIDAVVVSVGGGGLLAGIASVLRTRWPGIKVIGAQPEASAAMAAAVRHGEVVDVDERPTLSDGTAGGIEADALTLPFHRALVDEFVLVSEFEIAAALLRFADDAGVLVEGSAALALAAAAKRADALQGGRVAVIVCGGNIADDALATAIDLAGQATGVVSVDPP